MALMQPAPEFASYGDVPWFRRTWFVVVMILLFWPAAFVIAATGDHYQKANSKMRKQSDAEVWRSTKSGRALMAGAGIVLAGLYGPQLYAALTANDARGGGQAITAPAPPMPTIGSELVPDAGRITAGSSRTTNEGSTPTTPAPADDDEEAAGPLVERPDPRQEAIERRLDEVLAESRRVATAVVGTTDLDVVARALFGDDRFAGTPIPNDGRIRTASGGMSSDDELQAFLSGYLLSDRTIDEVADEMSVALRDAGWTGEERSEQTDDGRRTIDIDVEPKVVDGYDSISVTIEETEEGPAETRVFRFLGDPDDVAASSLLGRGRPAFPFPDSFEIIDVELSIRDDDATLRIEAKAPESTEQQLVDAARVAAAPSWSVDRINGTIVTLESNGLTATLFPYSSDRSSTLTVRIE